MFHATAPAENEVERGSKSPPGMARVPVDMASSIVLFATFSFGLPFSMEILLRFNT